MTYHTFEFEYEVEAFGQPVLVEVKARLSPPGHSHPGDPDNIDELEITSVTLHGWDVDPDSIRVARKKLLPPLFDSAGHTVISGTKVNEWFKLTDLLREAAWERAEREAA